jgi:hypothetical protein
MAQPENKTLDKNIKAQRIGDGLFAKQVVFI